MLLGDEAQPVLCLRYQGWTRSSSGYKIWRCPTCTATKCYARPLPLLENLRCAPCHRAAAAGPAGAAGGQPEPEPAAAAGLAGSASGCGRAGGWQPEQGWWGPEPPPPPRQPPRQPPQPPLSVSLSAYPGFCGQRRCLAGVSPLCDTCLPVCTQLKSVSETECTQLVVSLHNLSFKLNCLPAHLLPAWSVDVTASEARQAAAPLQRGLDHGNCAASAMLLALLRPRLFHAAGPTLSPWTPLRIFGVPPPDCLLQWDRSPQSGRGPDNFRGNIIEGLNVFLGSLRDTSDQAAEAQQALQETWMLFRSRVDIAAMQLGIGAPVQAWMVVRAALTVSDDALVRG